MTMCMEGNWMSDIKNISGDNLTVENFKDFVLELERINLRNLDREDKKQMAAKILRNYEEAIKDDNK